MSLSTGIKTLGDAPKSVFQIRSSWAQFLILERLVRLEKSISCVFSTSVNIPIPPAGTKMCALA